MRTTAVWAGHASARTHAFCLPAAAAPAEISRSRNAANSVERAGAPACVRDCFFTWPTGKQRDRIININIGSRKRVVVARTLN